jgi:hypothetical protein
MNKIISSVIILVVVIVVGVLALTFYKGDNSEKELSWKLVDAGMEESISAPKTSVVLSVDGKDQEIGTYIGSCFDIADSSWALLENEKTGVICYWAGGGKEIGVFEENNKLIIKTGDLEEGSEETPGFRGNFIELRKIN